MFAGDVDTASQRNYNVGMRAAIVKIGNSQGVRIPKPVLEQCQLGLEVELEVRDRSLVIRSAARPRAGWDEAFGAMAARGDDALLDNAASATTRWDQDEWEW